MTSNLQHCLADGFELAHSYATGVQRDDFVVEVLADFELLGCHCVCGQAGPRLRWIFRLNKILHTLVPEALKSQAIHEVGISWTVGIDPLAP